MDYIKGYEGRYSITEDGKVWSHLTKKYLKQGQKQGYPSVNLYKDGGYKTYRIHRLVAETFIPNPNNLPQVNHKDENRGNCSKENLEWCDASYNINYGNRNKKISKPVRCVETGKVYPSQHEASRQTGIPQAEISHSCKDSNYVAYGYHWELTEVEYGNR